MFIKQIDKKDRKGKLKYSYYRLCESYRIGNKSRQRTVLNLGKLEELKTDRERKQLADRFEALLSGKEDMFLDTISKTIELLAQKFYAQYCQNKKVEEKQVYANVINDREDIEDETIVKLGTLSHEEVREVGAEWLCLQAIEQLDLRSYFSKQGWDEKQINTTLAQIISKAVYPASENKTSDWIEDNTAIKELLFDTPVTISRYRLYNSGTRLYKCKDSLEPYLSRKTNELFETDDKIMLYDLTNTYFEGSKLQSKKSKFGHSKEKRSDAKLLALAMVCNREGFVKYSKIYSGNISDPVTLCETIDELARVATSQSGKPIVVIDAGISTKENLKLIKDRGYDYLCVTRSKLKDYIVSENGKGVMEINDKRGKKIEIRQVEKQGESDKFLYVHSYAKGQKEEKIKEYFSQRFEEELNNIRETLHKKGGRKIKEKIYERLGRIKERYTRASKYYNIEIKTEGKNATEIKWNRIEFPNEPESGVYFLRTSRVSLSEKDIWDIYNTLTQIEATFRTLKTDLHIRPIYHKTDENSDAHIYLGVVAYMLVSTIRYQLKKNNIHHDWKNIVRIMNTQKVVTSKVKDDKNQTLIIKKCSRPSSKVLEIYQALNYKQMPFKTKKYVLPQ